MFRGVVLTVDHGRSADAALFFAAGAHLVEVLDDLSEAPDVDWQVTKLKVDPVMAVVEPAGASVDAGFAAVKSLMSGLSGMQRGGPVPHDWSPDAVAHAKELVRSIDADTKLERAGMLVTVDQQLRDALETKNPWSREFYGSVRGRLTGVNVTRGNRASIRPDDGGRVVHVGFPRGLAEQMKDGLLQYVEVEGTVRQNAAGRNYHVVAERLDLLTGPVASWTDLRRSVPHLVGDMTVNEYLEAMRGQD